LANSVVSTPGAEFSTADIDFFYLETPMECWEYAKYALALIPNAIIQQYQLWDMVDNQGFVYVEIMKGMYGLPQAGILANKLLTQRLEPHGYYQCDHTPGLWRHRSWPIMVVLVVDDFGVKSLGKEHAQHLFAALKQHYGLMIDWTGTIYCGITFKWDYANRVVDLSMPGYVEAALKEYKHIAPTKREDQPYQHNPPQYGTKIQMTKPVDDSELLNAEGILRIQQITENSNTTPRQLTPQ
jgi:hypothetical protein